MQETGERRLNVSGVLKILGVSRIGYLRWKKRLPSNRELRNFVWFNSAQTKYAEIIYTIDDVAQEPIIHDAKEMDIFINESPAKDYRISVIYYDEDGNKYQ